RPGRAAADGQGQGGRPGSAGAAVCGARVAVHRNRVRGHDGHPVRGCVAVPGQGQVRRTAGVLAEGHRGARPGARGNTAGARAQGRGGAARRVPPLALPVDPRSGVSFRDYPNRTPLLSIATARPALLVTLTLPERLEAGHVEFARQLACHALAYAVAVERR